MQKQLTPEEKIQKARTLLLLDQPFFGTLALNLEVFPNPDEPTGSTDGVDITYNPEWIDGLSVKETEGFFAHEVMHVAHGHPWRMGERKPGKWNRATDHVINGLLDEAGVTLPNNQGLISKQFADQSAEQVYNKIPDSRDDDKSGGSRPGGGKGKSKNSPDSSQNQQGGKGGGKGNNKQKSGKEGSGNNKKSNVQDPNGCGAVRKAPKGESKKKMEGKWKRKVAQAAMTVQRGDLPGGLKKFVENLLEPDLPWETIFMDFMENTAKDDYDWTIPSRRYLSRDIILPGLRSEELPETIWCVDTSGSTQRFLNKYASVVNDVLAHYDTKITLIYADAKVQRVEQYTRADLPLKLEMVGGGGTNFVPTFEWVKEHIVRPSCMLYLTDMYGKFPSEHPDYPVLWFATGSEQSAPFGEVIDLSSLLD